MAFFSEKISENVVFVLHDQNKLVETFIFVQIERILHLLCLFFHIRPVIIDYILSDSYSSVSDNKCLLYSPYPAGPSRVVAAVQMSSIHTKPPPPTVDSPTTFYSASHRPLIKLKEAGMPTAKVRASGTNSPMRIPTVSWTKATRTLDRIRMNSMRTT